MVCFLPLGGTWRGILPPEQLAMVSRPTYGKGGVTQICKSPQCGLK